MPVCPACGLHSLVSNDASVALTQASEEACATPTAATWKELLTALHSAKAKATMAECCSCPAIVAHAAFVLATGAAASLLKAIVDALNSADDSATGMGSREAVFARLTGRGLSLAHSQHAHCGCRSHHGAGHTGIAFCVGCFTATYTRGS